MGLHGQRSTCLCVPGPRFTWTLSPYGLCVGGFFFEAKLSDSTVNHRGGAFGSVQPEEWLHSSAVDVQWINCTAALTHWRIIGRVLSLLPHPKRQGFQKSVSMVGGAGFPGDMTGVIILARGVTGTVDSHFHLDKLLQRVRKATLVQVEESVPAQLPISHFVAIYCIPVSWPTLQQHQFHARDDRIHFTYGIHPRQASRATVAQVSLVAELLWRPRLVALGEIGLDYVDASERCHQQQLLTQLLPLAVTHALPVVIHCRDRGSQTAATDCCRELWECLPRDHPIHLHCFSDGLREMELWQNCFPNLFWGVYRHPPKANRNCGLNEVVRQLAFSKILLETDAPYLLPPGLVHREANTPWFLGSVASQVAELTECCVGGHCCQRCPAVSPLIHSN